MHIWKRKNATEALGEQCRFTKGHHKGEQGDYKDEFRSAMHHATTQHQSTSCSGSRKLSTLQIVDARRKATCHRSKQECSKSNAQLKSLY